MSYILVVEDDPAVGSMLKEFLLAEGFDVKLAASAVQGREFIEEECPLLMITDIIMPDITGLSLITEINQKWPDLPIIAISGGGRNDPQNLLTSAETLGARRAFPKPVAQHILIENVSKLIH